MVRKYDNFYSKFKVQARVEINGGGDVTPAYIWVGCKYETLLLTQNNLHTFLGFIREKDMTDDDRKVSLLKFQRYYEAALRL
jgi:hypothetical protein